ncbi:MAG: hypothetical protein QM718_11285 [Steroidobacteraceae bacterium]
MPEDTLPSAALLPPAVAVRVPPVRAALPTVLALSDDPALIDALAEGCRNRAQLLVAPSLERFTDQLITVGASQLWLDCAASPIPMAELVTRLRNQFPALPLLISGSSREQRELADLLRAEQAPRFIHKPASGTRLALLLETALRASAQGMEETADAARGAPTPRPSRSLRLLLAAALLLTLLSGGWLLWRQGL